MNNSELIIAIIKAILRYGPQVIVSIAEAMQSISNITASDIDNLYINEDPEEYFK